MNHYAKMYRKLQKGKIIKVDTKKLLAKNV